MSTNSTSGGLSPSVRLALLAFALSSWFEGYSQLRQSVTATTAANLFDSSFFSFTISLNDLDGSLRPTGDANDTRTSRMNPFWRWLQRKGRRMDDTERGIMGTLDVLSSLALLHVLRTGPLFPFLVTPLLTSIPLPAPRESVRSLRWSKLLLTSLALCLFREVERVTVAQAVALHRSLKDKRDGVYIGKVVIRGAPLPQQRAAPRNPPSSSSTDLSWMYESDEDEELSCMICTGNNADLAQSVTSISSHASRSSTSGSESGATGGSFGPTLPSGSTNLGPLEAFCSVAPTKHVAHRGCILRWHATYNESQRQRLPPLIFRPNGELESSSDVVLVAEEGGLNLNELPPVQRTEEATRRLRRAKTLLRLAGFNYLLDILRVAPSSTAGRSSATRSPTMTTPLLSTVPSTSSTSTTLNTSFTPTFVLAAAPSQTPSMQPRIPRLHNSRSTTSSYTSSARTSWSATSPAVSLPRDHLATLRTEWPPCPGCRSPIDLHFCASPSRSHSHSRSPSHHSQPSRSSLASTAPESNDGVSLGFSDLLPKRLLAIISAIRSKLDKKNTTALVTGRTIALSLSAQLSFLLTISSMMHARERTTLALEAMERELRARRAAKS